MGVRLVGAVVTGPIASMSFQDEPVGCRLLRKLADIPDRVLVEGRDLPSGILSRMAALSGSLRAAKSLTYLDTLPRLETLVMQLGEPAWASLLTVPSRQCSQARWILVRRNRNGLPKTSRKVSAWMAHSVLQAAPNSGLSERNPQRWATK